MTVALVIRGRYVGQTFIPEEPLPLAEGTAELINDAEARAHWARQIAGRYMGSDLAETYGKRNSVEGELIVRVTPTHILAQKAIAD